MLNIGHGGGGLHALHFLDPLDLPIDMLDLALQGLKVGLLGVVEVAGAALFVNGGSQQNLQRIGVFWRAWRAIRQSHQQP